MTMRRARVVNQSKVIDSDIDQIDDPERKTCTVVLMNGKTYEYMGMKFLNGVPKELPIKFRPYFKSNGWFQTV